MNIIETDYWCLMLPDEWSAEQSDDVVLITDQDGIGELAVTTLVLAAPAALRLAPAPVYQSDVDAAAFSSRIT